MVFLPASFVAASAVFGMNIKELSRDTQGTLPDYFAAAIPFTVATIWIVIAFQRKATSSDETNILKRFAWPAQLCLPKLGVFPERSGEKSDDGVSLNPGTEV
ncbi:hypothetical protein D9615_003332 [Tricholomella constricta]|uniref:Uncharacterized protein n=1 Tax=Tricholomella constricta TaxID=117010 RepID=A0A8H5HIR9_9AGAR|nr:hypothetical protein D9615_003332 [Tricholomella constricta]